MKIPPMAPLVHVACLVTVGCANDGLKDATTDYLKDACLTDIPSECPVQGFSLTTADSVDGDFRAMHIGIEATNAAMANRVSLGGAGVLAPGEDYDAYFDFLDDTNVNWVGIAITLRYDGTPSASTVTLDRSPDYDLRAVGSSEEYANSYTYPADVLAPLVAAFKSRGIQVMLNFALEPGPPSNNNVAYVRENIGVPLANWPSSAPTSPNPSTYFWDPGYADAPTRDAAITAFWDGYRSSVDAVLADVCDPAINPGDCPDMVSIGTETNGLFRADADWLPHIQAMVDDLRDGTRLRPGTPLTFGAADSLYGEARFVGTQTIWGALQLDHIGVDTYAAAADQAGPATQCDYEVGFFKRVFNPVDQLQRLMELNQSGGYQPRVLFLEAGWADITGAATGQRPEEGSTPFTAEGRDTQSDLLGGLFSIREACDDMVLGAFLWGHNLQTELEWGQYKSIEELASFSIRPYQRPEVEGTSVRMADEAQRRVAFFYSGAVWDREAPDNESLAIPGISLRTGSPMHAQDRPADSDRLRDSGLSQADDDSGLLGDSGPLPSKTVRLTDSADTGTD